MKNSKTSRSSRQPQDRSVGSRGTRGSQGSSKSYGNDYESSRFGSRGSSGRTQEDSGRFSSDDGGYYSNRNFSDRSGRSEYNEGRGSYQDSDFGQSRDQSRDQSRGQYRDQYRDDDMDSGRRSQSQRYAPYRSSEENYESGSRWDNDGYGESRWNRPEGDRSDRGERNERGDRNDRSDRSDRSERSSRPERSSRWGKEDFGWGGRMSGRDQEMGYNTDMTDEDNYGDFEGISGGRSARFSDVDDVEGQYDEDYRDRDSYSRSSRGSRSSQGSRR